MTTVTVNEEIIALTEEIVETITVTVAEQGPPGVDADHSGLLNLESDDHLQYHTDARGDARYAALAHDHSGVYEPADADIQSHLANTSNPHSVTAAQVGADATGTAAGLIATHESAVNPHPGYLTPTEGDAAYAALSHDHSGVYEASGSVSTHAAVTSSVHGITTFGASLVDDADAGTARNTLGLGTAATTAATDYATAAHNHTGTYDPAGTASSAVSSHEGAADPHPGYALESSLGGAALLSVGTTAGTVASGDDARFSTGTTGDAFASSHPGGNQHIDWTADQGATNLHAGNIPDLSGTYAVTAKGVTNGDSHDHSGGDGAQIAYSGLSGLPTLGTAAATAATDYATAAQGATADTAVQPGDDAADLGSGSATDGYVLTADGVGGSAWEAAAVTYAGAASEIHAATEKTTPVDADELGLVDSAASWVLRRLTWANVKATLAGVFPLLAGKSGGQTLIGGTGVTDKLVLQGTSGNGTVTSTAVEFKVGNNGALTALTVANNGQLTIQGDASTDLPVYGSELLTSAGWTVNAGWTESPDDTFAHSSGTGTLTHSATITNGWKYQISWTITGRTAGSITIAVGGQSLAGQTTSGELGPTATSTAAFTITPTTDFNGTLSLVSLKRITAVSTPERVTKNSSGTVILEERGNSTSMFVGVGAGRYCTTGIYNVALGINAQYNLTTGGYNVALGRDAQYNLTTGGYNVALGANAQFSLTTGGSNVALGINAQYNLTTGGYNVALGRDAQYNLTTGGSNVALGANAQFSLTTGDSNVALGANAQRSLTTGIYNVALGRDAQRNLTTGGSNVALGINAQYNLTTGGSNVALGTDAGRYQADGSTTLTDPEYSIYIGRNARGKDNADNNSVVIGGNSPIGLGENTTVIGTSATTLTRLFGNLGLGVDSPNAAIHAIKTTEQLRLGYDATNYVSATVSSTGNLTLDTSGGTIYTPDVIENTTPGAGIVLRSPNGTRYMITVTDAGTLSVSAA